MHDVRADRDKNRLYITIEKIENEGEMEEIVHDVKEQAGLLQQGFTCLTDLRRYEVADETFEKYIRQAQEVLVDAGMSKVARVRKKFGALGHYQFDKISVEVGYHAQNATSMEDAEKMLDE